MTSERWHQVKALYHAALEREPSERGVFLAEACAGDAELRGEVESLLAQDVSKTGTLDQPAWAGLASSITQGAQLGPYKIEGRLGEGGMGEVFRGVDTRLGRSVAVKTTREQFSARFDREARAISSLNHPHICTLYDVGPNYLVMELCEGETLAARLKRGKLSIQETIRYGAQIADALSAAHAKGIVHRDLKPGNVMLTKAGVKVLDFGLAKSPEDETLTASRMVMGTPAYMAPEQREGKACDARTDIYALGLILYEMASGKRRQLDQSTPLDEFPITFAHVVGRCLERDPEERWQSARDLQRELEWAATPLLEGAPKPGGARPWLAWSGATVPWAGATLGLSIALALVLWAPWRKTTPPLTSLRLSAYLGADVSLMDSNNTTDAILSPDGAVLAFVARKEAPANTQLYLRPLNRDQATPLSGTDRAYAPFFSPDGQWIAFFAGGKLKKIGVSGGAVVTLCDAPAARGGAWDDDGTIVLSPDVGTVPNATLQRVSSAGGKPESLMPLAAGEATQRYPQVLPGGHSVLFTSSNTIGDFDNANLVVVTMPAMTRKVVQHGGYQGRYLSSGHLVYFHEGTFFAVPFDLGRLEATGQPVPVLEGVKSNSLSGGAELAVSTSGELVYVPGQNSRGRSPIHWLDREGKTTLLRPTPANWSNIQFAPDGLSLALEIGEEQDDIWVYEWERDTLTRLTSDPASDRKPAWTPDGRRIAFASTRADGSTPNLYWQRADGTGEAQRLTESNNLQLPGSWHPGGKILAFEEQNPQTGFDVMLLPMTGDDISGWKPGTPTVFLNSPFAERDPVFSPDGHWLAYSSNETGRVEVYVRSFPGPGGKWQISTNGGSIPTWSRTKHELFYETPGPPGRIMVAPFAVEGDLFRAQKPWEWPNGRYQAHGNSRIFDLHPDGERLALWPAEQTQGDAKQDHVTFIFNFFDELRRKVPVPK